MLPYVFGYERPRARYWPSRLLDQDFGLAITPDDLLTAVVSPAASPEYFRPWRQLAAAARDLGSSIKCDKDKLQINVDVQHFAPEELSVKTADGFVVVEGKHEERRDQHGFVARQFSRRYALPQGAAPDAVESRLSSDGVLTITVPQQPRARGERAVPITHTGPVRKEIKDHTEEKKDSDDKKAGKK